MPSQAGGASGEQRHAGKLSRLATRSVPISPRLVTEVTMRDEDDRPKKKISHEIGQELSLLSVEELKERITLLRQEIVRLEDDIQRKEKSRSAADAFFKL